MPYLPSVSAPFLAAVAACTPNGTGLVFGGVTFYPVTNSDHHWTISTTGDTITASVASELASARANADGSYATATGAVKVLTVNNGAALPETAPPPPPPPA